MSLAQTEPRPITADTISASDLLHELADLLVEMASAPPRLVILPSVTGYGDFDELAADLPEDRR